MVIRSDWYGFGASAGDPVAPGWQRTVEPQGGVVAPVTLEEFLEFIEEPCPPGSGSQREALYQTYLGMATEAAIQYMDRELEQRDIIVRFDQYPRAHSARGRLGRFDGHFEFYATLPRVPVAEFDRVEVLDEDGNTETLAADEYETDLVSEPARLHIDEPPIRADMPYFAGIRVYYTAGYADADAVPDAIKLGIQMHAGFLYENRGMSVESAMTKSGARSLYQQYRIWTGL